MYVVVGGSVGNIDVGLCVWLWGVVLVILMWGCVCSCVGGSVGYIGVGLCV